MKKVIIRKGLVLTSIIMFIFLSITLLIIIDMLLNWNFDNFLALGFSSTLTFLFLWIIADSYVQVIKFKKNGITINRGNIRYSHTKYDDIVELTVVTFTKFPQMKKGERLYGLRESYKMPKKIPDKWILIQDERGDRNISNIYSYLVPIRKYMPIKIVFDIEILEQLKIKNPSIKVCYREIS